MKWKAEPIVHKGDARIALHFDYSKAANERLQYRGFRASQTLLCKAEVQFSGEV